MISDTSIGNYWVAFFPGSGSIDFDEFVDIFARKVTIDPEAELKEVFCVFDSDHDGFISPRELFNVLCKLGEKITLVTDEFHSLMISSRF